MTDFPALSLLVDNENSHRELPNSGRLRTRHNEPNCLHVHVCSFAHTCIFNRTYVYVQQTRLAKSGCQTTQKERHTDINDVPLRILLPAMYGQGYGSNAL